MEHAKIWRGEQAAIGCCNQVRSGRPAWLGHPWRARPSRRKKPWSKPSRANRHSALTACK
ncbi:hypothetical protein SFOMI_0293 [Sphingobium fuliginis]|uniref:Uncharacterized protein n=1 Tax=Sphingobium fuliginis (strain ATCC 27551) TaxID=336203 RepID=A0A292YWJ5_SPHSA|nr:hypothetical protein SFOMI_0293 [Sphingobium fuliginis]